MRPIRIILPLVALLFSCLCPADILAQPVSGKDKAVLVDELDPAIVQADARFVKQILGKVKEAKVRNNPERRKQYDCEPKRV